MNPTRVLPAEWAPQAAVLLTWPHDRSDWGPRLAAVERTYVELAVVICRYQTLLVCCRDASHARHVQAQLAGAALTADRYRIGIAPSNDVWARDHGPITVVENGRARYLNFRFNGWGGKYPAELDNAITPALHAQGLLGNTPLTDVDCVLEGGAIETDGEGVMLTTRRCLPSESRNPGMDTGDLERLFRELFGIHTTHWLTHGYLSGDDTDSHIDTLARFSDTASIVYQGCDDPDDEHYEPLRAMAGDLAKLKRPDGQAYRLRALPLPAAIHDQDGQRLPAGYANFLIINGAVLMPGYADPADTKAATILGQAFPTHEIITIDCRSLIHQYGSLHCVTMQIPAVAGEPSGP